jgi:D-hydroxyproline dehydrogenase subunit alpha
MTAQSAGHSNTTADALRIARAGVERAGERISFTFAGQTLTGLSGETIAAALTAAGQLSYGRRRSGEGRGLYCGMGVCQECLVCVDGRASQRACMTLLTEGMRIEEQGYAVDLSRVEAPAVAAAPPSVLAPEVLVIGAGPAGLAAATAASECGAEVLLVDARSELGGQYYKQVAKSYRITASAELDRQFRDGRALIGRLERLGVETWRNASVWGAFAPLEIAILAQGRQHVARPKRLVLATGAYERTVPFSGWTLPGCIMTGAGQTLLRAYGVAPGRRVLIAGNGPLNFQLAAELVAAGVDVAALVEAAARPGLSQGRAIFGAAAASPELMLDGAEYLARLKRARVPIIYASAIARAEGGTRVDRAMVARIDGSGRPIAGTERAFEVDSVCTGFGLLPTADIALSLGCHHVVDAETGSVRISRDDAGRTSVPEIRVVGDGGGIIGARASLEQGLLAGVETARSLGHEPRPALAGRIGRSLHLLQRQRRFQANLWKLFSAPVLGHQLAMPDVEICRCEGITRAEIDSALAGPANSLAAVKRQTRAGMGRCQGRVCGPLIAAIARSRGAHLAWEDTQLAPRPPVLPLPLGTLAEKPIP